MRKWGVIAALAAGQFIMVLDTTVMNVSITQVAADLDTDITMLQLAITMYTLVMAAFMMLGGKLGDIWGRKRAFTIGLLVYGTGSLITALSPTIEVLIFGWSLIEGLGAALVIPAIASLAAANYTGRDRAVAYSVLGAATGIGAALGPLIGGLFTTYLSWRWVFAGETIVVLLMLPALRIIKAGAQGDKPKLDWVGAVLSVVTLSLIVFGILKGGEWGFLIPKGAMTINGNEITPFGLSVVPFLILGGAVIGYVFLRYEAKLELSGKTPLIRPSLLEIAQLKSGLSMYLVQYLVLAGVFFVIPVYLQVVLGKNAIETGLKILPMSVALVITSALGPKLAMKSSPRFVVQVGLSFVLAGVIVLMATIDPALNDVGFFIGVVLFGAGLGLTISQLGNVVMSSVDETAQSETGGLQGTSQNLGSALGTAFIGAVLLVSLTSDFQEKIATDPAIPSSVSSEIISQTKAGVQIVNKEQAEEIATDAGLPPQQVDAVVEDYVDAQLVALTKSFFWVGILTLLGFIFARGLPARQLGTEPEVESEVAAA